MTSPTASSTSPRLRDRVVFRLMVVALALSFFALVLTGGGDAWLGRIGYLLSAGLLGVVARMTWDDLPSPYRLAAVATLGGLASTELFAVTELGLVDPDARQGVAVLIPPAWLFTAIGWVLHVKRVHTVRWVVTLVQLSFTALGSLLFVSLAARNEAESTLGVVGYGAAAVVGAASVVLAVVAAIRRIRIELSKRHRSRPR